MGGPCYVKHQDGRKSKGPPATDNFQVIPFKFPLGSGVMWCSAEQCYQAQKGDPHTAGLILDSKPFQESDSAYGNRIWRIGQQSECSSDWEDRKLEAMYLVNCAKYACNPSLHAELLATGDDELVGGPSTWEWSKYNGLIQMAIRRMIRENVDLSSISVLDLAILEH